MTQLIAKRLQAGYTLTPSSSQGSEDMYEHHSNGKLAYFIGELRLRCGLI